MLFFFSSIAVNCMKEYMNRNICDRKSIRTSKNKHNDYWVKWNQVCRFNTEMINKHQNKSHGWFRGQDQRESKKHLQIIEIKSIKLYSKLISIELPGMNEVTWHFEDLEYLNMINIHYSEILVNVTQRGALKLNCTEVIDVRFGRFTKQIIYNQFINTSKFLWTWIITVFNECPIIHSFCLNYTIYISCSTLPFHDVHYI